MTPCSANSCDGGFFIHNQPEVEVGVGKILIDLKHMSEIETVSYIPWARLNGITVNGIKLTNTELV